MKEFEWVRAADPGDRRLMNMIMKIKAGEYRGLELPVTFYDD